MSLKKFFSSLLRGGRKRVIPVPRNIALPDDAFEQEHSLPDAVSLVRRELDITNSYPINIRNVVAKWIVAHNGKHPLVAPEAYIRLNIGDNIPFMILLRYYDATEGDFITLDINGTQLDQTNQLYDILPIVPRHIPMGKIYFVPNLADKIFIVEQHAEFTYKYPVNVMQCTYEPEFGVFSQSNVVR